MFPSYYEFYNPVKILSGEKALENIAHELDQANAHQPLIITDQGVEKAGLLKTVKKAFDSSNTVIGAIFDEVPPDSSHKLVNSISQLYHQKQCDSIIAVGGGSVIDTAKGVNILVSEDSDNLMNFAGADMLKNPLKPFFVIPTTAGTGSEVTMVAVIYNEERNVKMSFTSHRLYPNAAVIDPRMTMTMPPHITASTAMDALAHAIEAYTCLQKNPLSDAYATTSIRLIFENLLQTVKNGKDKTARLKMANAATMAGIAFSNSMVGMVHSLGHATGSIAHVPHGITMSIFLPHVLEYNMATVGEMIGELLLFAGGEEEYAKTPTEQRATRTIEIIKNLQSDLQEACSLPTTLKEAGVEKDQLGLIAKTAINDPSITFNPEEMEYNDALKILEKAYE